MHRMIGYITLRVMCMHNYCKSLLATLESTFRSGMGFLSIFLGMDFLSSLFISSISLSFCSRLFWNSASKCSLDCSCSWSTTTSRLLDCSCRDRNSEVYYRVTTPCLYLPHTSPHTFLKLYTHAYTVWSTCSYR